MLKYAHEDGCPWDEETCCYAVLGGHLNVLTYAHENGCPWDERTCCYAAEGGHLDVLKYARENGCPWDMEECLAYARILENPQIKRGSSIQQFEKIKAWILSQPDDTKRGIRFSETPPDSEEEDWEEDWEGGFPSDEDDDDSNSD